MLGDGLDPSLPSSRQGFSEGLAIASFRGQGDRDWPRVAQLASCQAGLEFTASWLLAWPLNHDTQPALSVLVKQKQIPLRRVRHLGIANTSVAVFSNPGGGVCPVYNCL